VHLSSKALDAEDWFAVQKDAAYEVALPVAKKAIVYTKKVADFERACLDVAWETPELIAGTVIGLLSMRMLGWKARGAVSVVVLGSWIVFAPTAVSDVTKSTIKIFGEFGIGSDAAKNKD
jgi:hypothetical protein